MKKVTSVLSAGAALLVAVPQALAQAQAPVNTNLNPCPPGQFSVLCGFSDMGKVLGFVITIAFIIAILIALFYLIWGGIKWITSGGDKGGVETARNQIISAIVGLIIVFLAFFILNLVLGLFGLSLFNLKLPNIGDFR